jgi:ABC-type branched-subunit amino acid transport system permease subunit
MPPVGVDEWVARAEQRREQVTGIRSAAAYWNGKLGWWPRLAALAAAGFIVGQLGLNLNLQAVAFNCALYALLALGLNIAVGWAGLLDLGYIAFFGVGAYGYALLSSHALGNLLGQTGGVMLPTIATVPIVMVACGILGMVVGLVALRLEGDYLAIVTLFLGLAFVEVVNNVDQGTLGGNNGIYSLAPFHAFGHQIASDNGYYYVTLAAVIVLMAGLHLLELSRTGRAWKALRDDPLAARVMGVPVSALRVMAFSFGAVVAALAGAVFAGEQGSVFPNNFQSSTLILIYACLVVGGIGGIGGAVLGGVVVTVAEALLSSPTDSAYLFYGLILVALVARIRPWRRLAAVLAGIVGFGVALRAIVGAISQSAVAGSPGSSGWLGSLMRHYVIVPHSSLSYGNILYVALIPALVLLVRLKGTRQLVAVIPTVYLAACCWESRLIVDPGITAQIMLGAMLIVTMAARPNGILGKGQVPVI